MKIRKGRLGFVLFVTIMIIGLFVSSLTASASSSDDYIIVIVNDGDTLWNIAQTYSTDNNIRRAIFEIEQMNDIRKSIIHPGQELKIPRR